jgi:hypothetical protein
MVNIFFYNIHYRPPFPKKIKKYFGDSNVPFLVHPRCIYPRTQICIDVAWENKNIPIFICTIEGDHMKRKIWRGSNMELSSWRPYDSIPPPPPSNTRSSILSLEKFKYVFMNVQIIQNIIVIKTNWNIWLFFHTCYAWFQFKSLVNVKPTNSLLFNC